MSFLTPELEAKWAAQVKAYVDGKEKADAHLPPSDPSYYTQPYPRRPGDLAALMQPIRETKDPSE